MSDIPIEQRHKVLCGITRAQHFAWRQAAAELCTETDPAALVQRMWRIVGEETAEAYLRRFDRSAPLAPQVAESIAYSSQCMGEQAVVEPGASASEARVRHHECPWREWHERKGLLDEDRPGCDAWFAATIDTINQALGTQLRFETLQSLPDGDSSCLRRLWDQAAP